MVYVIKIWWDRGTITHIFGVKSILMYIVEHKNGGKLDNFMDFLYKFVYAFA